MEDYQAFYKSKEWYKTRAVVLREAGYTCVICKANVRVKGTSRVDHIVPLRQNWERRFDKTNLRVLCTSCDNKRHSEKARTVERVEIDENGYPSGWR